MFLFQCKVGSIVTVRVGGNFHYDLQQSDDPHDLLLVAGGTFLGSVGDYCVDSFMILKSQEMFVKQFERLVSLNFVFRRRWHQPSFVHHETCASHEEKQRVLLGDPENDTPPLQCFHRTRTYLQGELCSCCAQIYYHAQLRKFMLSRLPAADL